MQRLKNPTFTIYNKQIKKLKEEIYNTSSVIDTLNHEMKILNQDTLILQQEFRYKPSSDKNEIMLGGSAGGFVGLSTSALLPTSVLGSFLTAGAFSVGFFALGAGVIAVKSYLNKNYISPINIEYKGIFHEVKHTCSKGKFVIIESKPEQEIFRAQFCPEVLSDAALKVELLVKKNQKPENVKRIKEISEEIIQHETFIQLKENEVSKLIRMKDQYAELTYLTHPSTLFKKPSSVTFCCEDKTKKLTIPLAEDGEGILNFLKEIKSLKMSPISHKEDILNLLKNEKFPYDSSDYFKIIKKLDELGLLADADIFNVIAQHPEEGATAIYGYSKAVPPEMYSFWNITSSKKSFERILGSHWKKGFEKSIQQTYWSDNKEDILSRNFAYSLIRNS